MEYLSLANGRLLEIGSAITHAKVQNSITTAEIVASWKGLETVRAMLYATLNGTTGMEVIALTSLKP